MESAHRKIELQSPGDLTYLQTQIRRAARQKLDLHLPPVSNSNGAEQQPEPDDLRRKTEELVDIFVAQILEGMRQNVSINGMDVSGSTGDGDDMQVEVEEYEDLDNKLRERLRSTIARRDALVGKIAVHRRGTAKAAGERFKEQFGGEMEGLERAREEAEKRAGSMEGREAEVVGVEALKRGEEVEKRWGDALVGLERVNTGLGETTARLERAGEVVGYLTGKEKEKGRARV